MDSTIPIIIDSIKREDVFPFTRCFYFCIETTTPSPGWELSAPWYRGPMVLLGMSAIILGPTGGEGRFESPDSFERLIDIFDQDELDFYLDQNALWVPNMLLKKGRHERGSVYRMSLEAFRLAYAFTDERIEQGLFIEKAFGMQEAVFFSPDETEAFAKWDKMLLEEIRTIYHENRSEMLLKKDMTLGPGFEIE